MTRETKEWRVVAKWAHQEDPTVHEGNGRFTEKGALGYAAYLLARRIADEHVEWVRVERRTVTPWEEA
jgi:hypothetical protein